ncbi:MAG: hypothetical protein HRF46_15445 [Acidobacteriota bacterium]|jgi:NhaP-type Na+/H+ and K+/H+ antiporter
MACVAHEVRAAAQRRVGVAVIADRGDGAEVVMAPLSGEPRVGDRFSYGGLDWVVVRAKDHLRGAVAVPVASWSAR